MQFNARAPSMLNLLTWSGKPSGSRFFAVNLQKPVAVRVYFENAGFPVGVRWFWSQPLLFQIWLPRDYSWVKFRMQHGVGTASRAPLYRGA